MILATVVVRLSLRGDIGLFLSAPLFCSACDESFAGCLSSADFATSPDFEISEDLAISADFTSSTLESDFGAFEISIFGGLGFERSSFWSGAEISEDLASSADSLATRAGAVTFRRFGKDFFA